MTDGLLENALRASAVLSVALVAAGFARRRSAAFRHRILAAGVVSALAMPALIEVAPGWQWPSAPHTPAAEVGAVVSTDASSVAAPARPRSGTLILAVWSLGCFASAASLAVGLARLRLIARAARPIAAPRWAGHLGRKVRFLESPDVVQVMTWGIFRPRIVLPKAAREWSPDRLRAVLGHELAHVGRSDWAWQIAAELLRAVYWFNPLARIASRMLREESERAADDEVIAAGMNGEDYAGHLLDLAGTLGPARSPAPGFAIAKRSVFERRVRALVDRETNRSAVSRPVLGTILGTFLIVGLLAAGCGASRTLAVQAPGGAGGIVTGTVADRTGARIPGVELRLTPVSGAPGPESVIVSDRTGAFGFTGVEPGDYRLTAALPGFRNTEVVGIAVEAGQTLRYDLSLQVAAASTAVVVSATRLPPPPPLPPRPFQPIRIGGNVAQGRLVRPVTPVYPGSERESGIEGVVVLEATIATDGTVSDTRVVTGPAGLREAAVAAVRQWQYEPYLLNGIPVETVTTITIEFNLRDPE